MAAPIRPRRSALYIPGSNTRALSKGREVAADIVLLDLEDAVAPDQKIKARGQVLAAVASEEYRPREVVVRINDLNSLWGEDDLTAVAASKADAVLLPKVESPDLVRKVAEKLSSLGAPNFLSIWCMMETPRGILNAAVIAGASPRLGCLVMGTSDLAKDLHARHTRDRLPFMASMGLCILAARANGLSILDGVCLDLEDAQGFAEQCHQGVALGFDGKTLIHPKTIDVTNTIFGPTEREVAEAHRIMAAFSAARKKGEGVVLLDGKLIESLHVENAQRVVTLAEKIAQIKTATP